MISAKEYFELFLTWQRRESNLRSAPVVYESYASLDLEALTAEAEAGNPGAQEELGERYLFGLSGLKADPEQALVWLNKAAAPDVPPGDPIAEGHPDAMQLLAEVRRTDQFGMQDYDRYFSLLKKAAERGSWKAMFNLSCAYYKGPEAYQGYRGDFLTEPDKKQALNWSTRCILMTMNLLDLFFQRNCANDFTEYLDGVFALFIQSVYVSARQLIRGDGVPKDVKRARSMVNDAQKFYKHYFGASCSDFETLLKHCDEEA